MKKKSNSPTMKDVAALAGVSLGTVSKVINNIPVGDDYRIRVEQAAKTLGYQVNNYARSLKTNKTNTIAVIMPSASHPFFGLLIDHLTRAIRKRDLNIMLFLSFFDMEGEQKCIELVRQNKVDGIIALTYSPDLEIDTSIPFVSIDRYYASYVPCISSDNFGGGILAGRMLVNLGCKSLLFVRTGSAVTGEPDKRGIGFENYCQANNIPVKSIRLNDADGLVPLKNFLKEHVREKKFEFDGIFCSTDHLAATVIRYLNELGIRIPEDVQIIGFDGIPRLPGDPPAISTIVQPVETIAETAVQTLLSANRSSLPSLTCLPVEYRPGWTTKDGKKRSAED